MGDICRTAKVNAVNSFSVGQIPLSSDEVRMFFWHSCMLKLNPLRNSRIAAST